MGPASIAQASTDPVIMLTFGLIRGTRGLVIIAPAVGPTGTAMIAGRIITTGRMSTTSKSFRHPGCFRHCRRFSGRITRLD